MYEILACSNLIYTIVFLTMWNTVEQEITIKGQIAVFLGLGMKTNTTNIPQEKA